MLSEHTVVRTTKYITEGNNMIPLHSRGTIVGVHPNGYDVEFPLRKAAFKAETGIDCPESIVVYCPQDSIREIKVPLYATLLVKCTKMVEITPTFICNKLGVRFLARDLDLGAILNELVGMYGEEAVVEWITEKSYHPIEHKEEVQ